MVVASVATILLSFFLPKSIELKRESPPVNTAASERDNTEEPNPDLPVNESSDELSLAPRSNITTPSQDWDVNSDLPIQTIGSCDKDTAVVDSAPADSSNTGTTDYDQLTIKTMS